MKPVLVSLDPTKLREQLQTDPTLLAMLDRGYTVATSCVLVDGPEGPEQRTQFALVLVPPPPPVAAPVALPSWAPWWAAGIVVLAAVQVALASYVATR